MIITKQLLLRMFLVGELCTVGFLFICGPQGFFAVRAVYKEHAALLIKIAQEEEEVKLLKKRIDEWVKNDFYKEKIARENLQMARPEEQVYVLN